MANGRSSSSSSERKKKTIAAHGPWVPVPLDFLRSRACAELSPHAAKLLLDVLALLGTNAYGNGDISLAPSVMAVRGWSSRATLGAVVKELEEHGLLVRTRQGGRLDCMLYALTLYPLNCDVKKLDAGAVGSYTHLDYEKAGGQPPTELAPATWRRARKTETLTPPRNEVPFKRSATVRTPTAATG